MICVFAKAVEPGQVKTRLSPSVGDAGAAALARAFLIDTCATMASVPWARTILALAGSLDPSLASQVSSEVWSQEEGDLGDRMERILRRALVGTPFALAVGTDSPGLPTRLLDQAREALLHSDAVLGPASDGGFFLLGLRRCPDGLLRNLPWSSENTFSATLERLGEFGIATRVIEPWFDVDRPADLTRLRSLLTAGTISAPATAQALGVTPR